MSATRAVPVTIAPRTATPVGLPAAPGAPMATSGTRVAAASGLAGSTAHRVPGAGVVPEPHGALRDRHGRTVRDLRLSLTDRCNLRCTYCMPAQGLDWLPSDALLTAAETIRLARLGVERLGVERIRLTGGEPLMRRDLEEIVAGLATLRTHAGTKPDLAMTTNGLGLDKRAARLRAAGLDRLNVSIDTVDRAAYGATTRRDRLGDVLAGAETAQAAGLWPVKVNAVALPGTLETQAPALLETCLRRGWELRFIEHMPLGPVSTWQAEDVVGAEQVLAGLRAAGFGLTEVGRPDRRPAALWDVAPSGDRPGGRVGVIASVTAPFCSDCDRTRITADGRLMTCLFSTTETDLRSLLRSGVDDDAVALAWAHATWVKPAAHGSDEPGFARPSRTMSAIGG